MANDNVHSAIGFLQKKNRFYGWNKCLFLLDVHGLALLSSDSLFRASGNRQQNPELPFQVIGNASGYDLRQAATLRPKQLIEPSGMSSVAAQGAKDVVVVTKSSSTLVLRAQTSADRNAWLHSIQSSLANCATEVADTPKLHNEPESEVCPSPAVVVPRTAPYIPTWTMSSTSVNGSIAKKLNLGLSGLELGLYSSSIEAEVPILDSKRIKVNSFSDDAVVQPPLSASPGSVESPQDLEDFDASAFFSDDGCDLPPLDTSATRSTNTLYNRTRNFTVNPQAIAPVSSPAPPAPISAPPLVQPAPPATTYSTLVPIGGALAGAGSMDFGGMFDFLLEPRTEPTSAHAAASLRPLVPSLQKVPEALAATPQTPQGSQQGETLARGAHLPLTAKQQEVPAMVAAAVLSGFGNSNMQLQNIASVASPLQSIEPISNYAPSRGLAGAIQAATLPNTLSAAKTTEPGVILTASVADYAGSLLDNMGLADWSRSLEPAPEHVNHSQIANASNINQLLQSGDPSTHGTGQQQAASAKGADQQTSKAQLLNSPEHHRLVGRNAEPGKRTVAINGHDAKRLTFDGSAVGLSGIQTSLLSKYSDSLSSSRSLMPGISRTSRPKPTHEWRTKTGGLDGQHISEQSATLVQYAPVEPANTGISKVIRGQIAKEIIQKEADSRPVVRRMRRVKSETKVAPLKSIRLRLDGSAVGSHTSLSQKHGSAKRGMSYVVKDGLIRGPGSRFEQGLGASQSVIASAEDSKHRGADIFGEFNEIQARLRMAEEHKRQQQRASLLDREGADDVRIADIIENRQDIPLASQLEERRKMQLAKQQALIQQQLVQQHRQMEQHRVFLEQQQQHQLFKRQSLHPSLNSPSQVSVDAAATYSGQQGGWQGHGSGNYADQWVQQQGAYGRATPTPARFQSPQHRAYSNGPPVGSISEASYQSMDIYGHPLGRSSTTNARLQPGAALYKHVRPSSAVAQSLHSPQSNVSSESWQSRPGPSMSTGIPARANTEINFDGSDCSVSPISGALPPRRTLSYGLSSHQRPASMRPGSLPTRQRTKGYDMGRAPPVPPLPQASFATSPGHKSHIQEYAYPPPHGPPGYLPAPAADQGGYGYRPRAYSSQWAASQPRAHVWVPQHGPLPPSQAVLARHSTYSQGYPGGGFAKQVSEAQMLADMQKISKRRTEMAADTPSLLQRLDSARTNGLLPGRHIEKQGYSQGAYQNQSATRQIRDASSAQYLGNGNTLLIDRVYESERSRSAFLKKISRTYTGIGGDVAPATTFTH